MTFFDDKRNRALLGGMLVSAGLLESIFFAYTTEELYSFLYPSMIDMLVAVGTAVLAIFLDFNRKHGFTFVSIGCLIFSGFAASARTWFTLGNEQGFYSIMTAQFWLQWLYFAVTCFGAVMVTGFVRKKDEKLSMKLMPCFLAFFTAFVSVVKGEDILYSIFAAFCAFLTGFVCFRIRGGFISLKILYKAVGVAGFICAVWMFLSYEGGVLLTVEAASAVDILGILAGLVMLFMGRRFGGYLYTFLPLHLGLAYAGAYIRGDMESYLLYGMLPCAVLFICGMIILWKAEEAEGNAVTYASLTAKSSKNSNNNRYKL